MNEVNHCDELQKINLKGVKRTARTQKELYIPGDLSKETFIQLREANVLRPAEKHDTMGPLYKDIYWLVTGKEAYQKRPYVLTSTAHVKLQSLIESLRNNEGGTTNE